MNKLILSVIFLVVGVTGVFSQQTAPKQTHATNEPSKVYWGGELGLSFGNYFRISVVPLVGYKVSPKFHVGAKLGFAYIEDKRYEDTKITSFNYGGSLFTRYLLFRGLYAQGELVYWSYKSSTDILKIGDKNNYYIQLFPSYVTHL